MKYEVIKSELHPVIRSRSSSSDMSLFQARFFIPIMYQTGLKLGRNRPLIKSRFLSLFFAQIVLETMEHFRLDDDFFRQKTNRIKDQTKKLDFLPTPNIFFFFWLHKKNNTVWQKTFSLDFLAYFLSLCNKIFLKS